MTGYIIGGGIGVGVVTLVVALGSFDGERTYDAVAAFLFAGFVAAVVSLVHWGIAVLPRQVCEFTAANMSRDHHWSITKGCFIEADDGELVPLDRWIRNEESSRP